MLEAQETHIDVVIPSVEKHLAGHRINVNEVYVVEDSDFLNRSCCRYGFN